MGKKKKKKCETKGAQQEVLFGKAVELVVMKCDFCEMEKTFHGSAEQIVPILGDEGWKAKSLDEIACPKCAKKLKL